MRKYKDNKKERDKAMKLKDIVNCEELTLIEIEELMIEIELLHIRKMWQTFISQIKALFSVFSEGV